MFEKRAGKNLKAKQRKAQRHAVQPAMPTATTVAQISQSQAVASTSSASLPPYPSYPPSSQPSALHPTLPASADSVLWMSAMDMEWVEEMEGYSANEFLEKEQEEGEGEHPNELEETIAQQRGGR
ncbi:hypothetical protein FRC03_003265 [Tulasnella sp. 419]|nr:hypothetical protein FRC02_010916 [Tulasnella sp. 418]KAG8942394.1 hypothetical protein FRC03_003265 [Tulasnella sp. 419]